jgi:hypothetical protein
MVYLLFDMGNEIEFERTYLFDVIDTIVYYNFVDRTPNQYKLIINHHQLYHCILIFLWLEPIVGSVWIFQSPKKSTGESPVSLFKWHLFGGTNPIFRQTKKWCSTLFQYLALAIW